MGDPEERPVREQYDRELKELVEGKQDWTPAEAVDEQIERETRELQSLLEAVRNLAQSRSLHVYLWNRWSSGTQNDRSALQPILAKAKEAMTTASEEVDRLQTEHEKAVQQLSVLFWLRTELNKK
jgi:hypothetical protein